MWLWPCLKEVPLTKEGSPWLASCASVSAPEVRLRQQEAGGDDVRRRRRGVQGHQLQGAHHQLPSTAHAHQGLHTREDQTHVHS